MLQEITQIPEVQELIKLGRKQGELSYDNLNDMLPETVMSDEMELIFILLENLNIPVVDVLGNGSPKAMSSNLEKAETDEPDIPLTDDPIKFYLNDVSKNNVLTIDEERALSERMCQGETVIDEVLFSTPYTIFAIDELIDKSIGKKNLLVKLIQCDSLYDDSANDYSSIKKTLLKLKDDLTAPIEQLKKINRNHDLSVDERIALTKDLISKPLNLIRETDFNFRNLYEIALNLIALLEEWIRANRELSVSNQKLNAKTQKSDLGDAPDQGKPSESIHIVLGGSNEDLKEWYKKLNAGKMEVEFVKDRLVQCNLRLVMSIAKKYSQGHDQYFDLVQEGNIGLMKAVDRFKYRKGFRFSTYATWWIKQAIKKSLPSQERLIRVPVHVAEQLKKLNKESRYLHQTLGRDPSLKELADRLDWDVDKVKSISEIAKEPVSLEAPLGSEENLPLMNYIEDQERVSDYDSSLFMLKDQLMTILSTLPEKEQNILNLRFGLIDGQHYTLKEAGEQLNLTRERVRQLEARAITRLREMDNISKQLRDYLFN